MSPLEAGTAVAYFRLNFAQTQAKSAVGRLSLSLAEAQSLFHSSVVILSKLCHSD